jgi:hypothetical protein
LVDNVDVNQFAGSAPFSLEGANIVKEFLNEVGWIKRSVSTQLMRDYHGGIRFA